MENIFIPVSNHPEFEINRNGIIRKIATKKELKGSYDKDGYKVVQLNYKHYRWHRLVAEHFVPNPENKPEVNHINHIRDDNRACNLNWMTRTEQYDHSLLNVGTQQNHRVPISQFDLQGKFIANYDSITDACRKLYNDPRYNSGSIARCVRLNDDIMNNCHKTRGFIWRRRILEEGSETIESTS